MPINWCLQKEILNVLLARYFLRNYHYYYNKHFIFNKDRSPLFPSFALSRYRRSGCVIFFIFVRGGKFLERARLVIPGSTTIDNTGPDHYRYRQDELTGVGSKIKKGYILLAISISFILFEKVCNYFFWRILK